VLLDEFHERHLQTDLAITLLARLRRGPRPDLRLGVMSATLDASRWPPSWKPTSSAARGGPFPVEVRHRPGPTTGPGAAGGRGRDGLYREGQKGHTLVFLPGARKIRQGLSACAPAAARHGLQLLPLHGSLSFQAQQEAVAPSASPR